MRVGHRKVYNTSYGPYFEFCSLPFAFVFSVAPIVQLYFLLVVLRETIFFTFWSTTHHSSGFIFSSFSLFFLSLFSLALVNLHEMQLGRSGASAVGYKINDSLRPTTHERQNRTVLNVTNRERREREKKKRTILISPPKFFEKKQREWERERERKVFLIPTVWAVCRTGASSQRHQVKLLVWVGVESRFTGIICKLISNESLKEKSFHRLRVIINTRNKNYNLTKKQNKITISFCAEFRNWYIFCVYVLDVDNFSRH